MQDLLDERIDSYNYARPMEHIEKGENLMEDTKYMDSKIQKVSIDEWIKLFKSAVRESDNNLDQFVEGSMVRIPEKTSETFVDILNQFITSAREVVFTCENVEKIWDDIKKMEKMEKIKNL